jgi:putative transposase
MRVSPSGYYAWRRCLSSPPKMRRKPLAKLVRDCYFFNRKCYGSRRIKSDLNRQGVRIGRYKVRRLMKEEGLQAIQAKRFKPRTTDSNGTLASPNLYKAIEIRKCGAGEVIVGDITYIYLQGGRFCYLAIWQDAVTKRIVGWSLSETMEAELVISALKKAITKGLIAPGAVIHSDRGSQYASNGFRRLLQSKGLLQSMSGKGNCYDNAMAESFFSRIKTELIEDGVFEDIEEARTEIFTYIEGYYNLRRLHSALGYQSPMEFEMKLKMKEAS